MKNFFPLFIVFLVIFLLIPQDGFAKLRLSTVWQQRIQASFAATRCPKVAPSYLPASCYQGPLIDSHFHIPSIPDASPDAPLKELLKEANKNHRLNLGLNITMGKIACTLKREGTQKVFAFFPVYPEIPEQMVEVVYQTMRRYSRYFFPFIMPPNHDDRLTGSPTVNGATLKKMLAVYPGLFGGYGEIGLYMRLGGSLALPPDKPIFRDIYQIAEEEKLLVYFHPGEGQEDNLARALSEHPTVNFVVHGDQIQPLIIGLMDQYSNVYFTMNDLYGDEWLLRSKYTKQQFLDYFKDYEPLIQKDLAMYQAMIERHPDRFMWGTDRSDNAPWMYDVEVGLQLVDYARAFIGRLPKGAQENFAYKNAQRLIDSTNRR